MLTPAFELQQDLDYLTIIIRAPYTKISESEIFIEDKEFKFYSKPYFLRLNLPGKITEDGSETAKYDADTGTFTIKVHKETHGEHFEGLDMLTKLLAPSTIDCSMTKPPLIEVIGGDESEVDCHGNHDVNEEEEIDWRIEQEPYQEDDNPLESPKYGFANQYSGRLKRLQMEMCDIIDVPDADTTLESHRRSLRKEAENDSFSDDHYLADLYHDDTIQELIKYKAPWQIEYKQWKGFKDKSEYENTVTFTDEEKTQMRQLPRRSYLIDEKVHHPVYLSLADLIFTYAFNHRSTEGENNVESSWTLCKLSPTLSWFEIHNNLKDMVVSCLRRSLCFPLYRHWKLSCRALRDTQQIFALGKKWILKCVLEMHRILGSSDLRYVLNNLYIMDYCVWIQSACSKQIFLLANALAEVTFSKEDIGLDLMELEQAGAMVAEEEHDTVDLTNQMEALTVSHHGQVNDNSTKSTFAAAERLQQIKLDQDETVSCDKTDNTKKKKVPTATLR